MLASLRAYAPPLKARLAPDAPFGIGLRLSGAESPSCSTAIARAVPRLARRARACTSSPSTASRTAPSTASRSRRTSTRPTGARGARRLHAAAGRDPGRAAARRMDGTISTSPLSYKGWIDDDGVQDAARRTSSRVADALQRHADRALDIEPEPDGALATIDDLHPLVAGRSATASTCACASTPATAVAYEDPAGARPLDGAASASARSSSSAALDGCPATARERAASAFADPIYLHQVTQRNATARCTYPDLPEALAGDGGGEEWRIHFHVPIFVDRYGAFESTQDELRAVLERVRDALAPRDRDLHLGRAAGRPEGDLGRVDRARVRVGARCPRLSADAPSACRPGAPGSRWRASRTRRPSCPTPSPAPCSRRPRADGRHGRAGGGGDGLFYTAGMNLNDVRLRDRPSRAAERPLPSGVVSRPTRRWSRSSRCSRSAGAARWSLGWRRSSPGSCSSALIVALRRLAQDQPAQPAAHGRLPCPGLRHRRRSPSPAAHARAWPARGVLLVYMVGLTQSPRPRAAAARRALAGGGRARAGRATGVGAAGRSACRRCCSPPSPPGYGAALCLVLARRSGSAPASRA